MKVAALAYGVAAYLGFLGVIVWAADFLAGTGYLGAGIDARPGSPVGTAALVDVALVAAFGVQHTIMARPAWKRWLPAAIERSTFVLASVAALALILWQWRSLPDVVWDVRATWAKGAIWALGAAGFAVLVFSTFLTDHFDLFGLRQVWLHARGRAYTPVPFQHHALYDHVRHPMMLGVLTWFWAAPTMTAGHALFAGAFTAYVVIGVRFEERALLAAHGEDYAAYRRRVRAFLPIRRGRA